MHCPPPPDSIMKKRTKLPRMEDHTDPPARLDTDKEYNNREQKLPIPIQTTPPPEATWGKYTKSFKTFSSGGRTTQSNNVISSDF